jgi:predicted phage terminase large subunit-like protein
MTTATHKQPSHTAQVDPAAAMSALRRQAGAASPMSFARIYLPEHFALTPSPMHAELFELLAKATRARGARLAVAAPRVHAKSTVATLAYVLWCICYRHERYIVIISHTGTQAEDLLTPIKSALTENPLLMEDFPEVVESSGRKPGPPRWRGTEIVTANGVRVFAVGAGGKLRGRRHGSARPGLIVLDDIEDVEQARSPDMRSKLRDYLTKTVAKAGTPETNIVVVGTILHFDSLLANLLEPAKSPGWERKAYKAVMKWSEESALWEQWERMYRGIEEYAGNKGPPAARAFFNQHQAQMLAGTQVLWPEKEAYVDLMEIRLRDGSASFDSEKQNVPVDPETCTFREKDLVYWDEDGKTAEQLLALLGSDAEVYGACDPSMGLQGVRNDSTAIVIIAKNRRDKKLYVLDADIRRITPDQTIDAIIRYQGIRNCYRFAVERNGFQGLMIENLERRSRQMGCPVRLKEVQNSGNKVARIESLQPFISAGQLIFSKRHVRLLEEMRQFPHAAHDDGPDALEMAVSAAVRGGCEVGWVTI